MKHSHSCIYPVPPEHLLRAFTDPSFYKAKYERLGTDAVQVDQVDDDGTLFAVRTRREASPDPAPPVIAAPFVPDVVRIRQRDAWDRQAGTGHTDVEFQGMPVNVAIDTRLTSSDRRQSIVTMDWTFIVDVPLLGRRLEKLLLETGLREAEREEQVTCELLSQFD